MAQHVSPGLSLEPSTHARQNFADAPSCVLRLVYPDRLELTLSTGMFSFCVCSKIFEPIGTWNSIQSELPNCISTQ